MFLRPQCKIPQNTCGFVKICVFPTGSNNKLKICVLCVISVCVISDEVMMNKLKSNRDLIFCLYEKQHIHNLACLTYIGLSILCYLSLVYF
jgi:hypothetical protein